MYLMFLDTPWPLFFTTVRQNMAILLHCETVYLTTFCVYLCGAKNVTSICREIFFYFSWIAVKLKRDFFLPKWNFFSLILKSNICCKTIFLSSLREWPYMHNILKMCGAEDPLFFFYWFFYHQHIRL